MHVDACGYKFNWKTVEVLDRGNSQNTRAFLKVWHPGQSAINKHIEIDPIYQPSRKIIDKYRVKNQINQRYNQNKEIDNDRLTVENK